MGHIDCPETSVRNYHCTLSNMPERHRYQVNRGGSLKLTFFFTLSQKNASRVENVHVIKHQSVAATSI